MSPSLMLVFLLLTTVMFVIVSEDPITIGLSVASYATAGALLMAVDYSSYYGYVLFFVYVGTLIVMFCIVVAAAPNPRFAYDIPVMWILLFWVIDVLALITNNEIEIAGSTEATSNLTANEMGGTVFNNLGQFTGSEWGYAVIALGVILLLAVVAVVGMSKRLFGPIVIFNTK